MQILYNLFFSKVFIFFGFVRTNLKQNKIPYLSWIEGPPPKRNAGSSNLPGDAICTAFAVLFLCAKNFRFLFICSAFLLIGNELIFEIC